jgi:hypothetical protein
MKVLLLVLVYWTSNSVVKVEISRDDMDHCNATKGIIVETIKADTGFDATASCVPL